METVSTEVEGLLSIEDYKLSKEACVLIDDQCDKHNPEAKHLIYKYSRSDQNC